MNNSSHKRYLHFRMQTTGGYINDPFALDLAKNALKEENARIAAIWVLGNYGSMDVVPYFLTNGVISRDLLKGISRIQLKR